MKKNEKMFMLEPHAVKLVSDYNISYPKHGMAYDANQAVSIAEEIGYPVVMKVVSSDISHKSDVGGIILGLKSLADIKESYCEIMSKLKATDPNIKIKGMLICEQKKTELEVIVGAIKDSVFDMVLMFGIGGVYTEIFNDVVFRSIPIKEIDAREMIKQIKAYPIFKGLRGKDAYDVYKLVKLLLSVSQLIVEHPEISELDLNPVAVFRDSVMALDVRVVING